MQAGLRQGRHDLGLGAGLAQNAANSGQCPDFGIAGHHDDPGAVRHQLCDQPVGQFAAKIEVDERELGLLRVRQLKRLANTACRAEADYPVFLEPSFCLHGKQPIVLHDEDAKRSIGFSHLMILRRRRYRATTFPWEPFGGAAYCDSREWFYVFAGNDAMSLYYFHLWDGDACERDEVGLECRDAEEAFMQAFRAAQDGWIDQILARTDPRALRFEVTDVGGNTLFELPFMEVVARLKKRPAQFAPIAQRAEHNCELVAEVARQVTRASANIRTSRLLIEQLGALCRGSEI